MAININVQDIIVDIQKMSNAEQLEVGNLIYLQGILNDEFKKQFKVIEGIKNGDKIPFGNAGRGFSYMKSTKGNTSQCDENGCDVSLELSTKTWQTGKYNCATEICFEDLEQLLLDYFNSDVCTLEEFSTSVFIDYLRNDIGNKLADSIFVKAYFGELGHTNTVFNGNDGLFIRMEAIAQPGHEQRVEIPENGQNTYELQKALAPQRGFDVFNAIRKKYTREMRKAKTPIRTTRLLAENYQEWLRNQNQVQCCAKDPLTNDYPLDKLMIFGIPIQIVEVVDDIIDELFNDGTKWVNPHRAWAISKDNSPVGTCNSGGFEKLDLKVNDYTGKLKFSPKYTLGVQILKDKEFVLAI